MCYEQRFDMFSPCSASPLSLQQLSRLAVRRKLGTRALNVIGQLEVPKLITSYLCYQ